MPQQTRVWIKIVLSKRHGVMLDRMAKETGVKRAALARSMIESILEDDAKAHRQAGTTRP